MSYGDRVLKVLATDPERWWTTRELYEACGILDKYEIRKMVLSPHLSVAYKMDWIDCKWTIPDKGQPTKCWRIHSEG